MRIYGYPVVLNNHTPYTLCSLCMTVYRKISEGTLECLNHNREQNHHIVYKRTPVYCLRTLSLLISLLIIPKGQKIMILASYSFLKETSNGEDVFKVPFFLIQALAQHLGLKENDAVSWWWSHFFSKTFFKISSHHLSLVWARGA